MDELEELLLAAGNTRTVLKGLQRQARAALQLAADFEARLARAETHLRDLTAKEAKRHGSTEQIQEAHAA